ncbi:2-keto-4-pentenoate hydratase/2-oxohepta-3-ene-1,7-dioic acid hydratase in catechol pathway [Sphingomonas sp. UYAg733]
MKLLRYADGAVAKLGVLHPEQDDRIVSLDFLSSEFPTMLSIIRGGAAALDRVRDIAGQAEHSIALAEIRLLPPIERPGKYLAIGMNYAKHIEEAKRLGQPTPTNQFWFNKQTSCLAGPFDDIDPGVTEQLDYEVELGVVIGKPAKAVSEDQAKDHVFGYVVADDVSARDWQRHSPTFTMGKSFDTHGPIGPWIVTADEIADPHALKLRCLVNGELRQDSNTSELVYNVWQQIAYLSTAFTLDAGDLIATGTPSGVGIGMKPPRFLQPGDIVRCEIDGIGAIENRVAQR